MPHDVRRFYVERIEEGAQVGGHLYHCVIVICPYGFTATAHVIRNATVAGGEAVKYRLPPGGGGPIAMYEDDFLAGRVARLDVMCSQVARIY
jgi:hypothetical protein